MNPEIICCAVCGNSQDKSLSLIKVHNIEKGWKLPTCEECCHILEKFEDRENIHRIKSEEIMLLKRIDDLLDSCGQIHEGSKIHLQIKEFLNKE